MNKQAIIDDAINQNYAEAEKQTLFNYFEKIILDNDIATPEIFDMNDFFYSTNNVATTKTFVEKHQHENIEFYKAIFWDGNKRLEIIGHLEQGDK